MNKKIIAELDKQLDASRVKLKTIKGRPDAQYLETYDVINTANRIFGYGTWGTQVVSIETRPSNSKTICIATLELTVEGCLPRQDIGVVISMNDKPSSIEMAVKGAVSDALKRAFRQYGKQFGNDLYAKDGVVVQKDQPAKPQASPQPKGEREAARDAETLRRWINTKAKNKNQPSNPTDKMRGLLIALLINIFGKGDSGDMARHQFLEFIFDRASTNDLTKGETSVLIDWAKGGKNPDGSYEASEVARSEGQMILHAWGEQHGQQELPM